jgi:hypothetical protein
MSSRRCERVPSVFRKCQQRVRTSHGSVRCSLRAPARTRCLGADDGWRTCGCAPVSVRLGVQCVNSTGLGSVHTLHRSTAWRGHRDAPRPCQGKREGATFAMQVRANRIISSRKQGCGEVAGGVPAQGDLPARGASGRLLIGVRECCTARCARRTGGSQVRACGSSERS